MTEIPSPGLGTSGNKDAGQCAETVQTALELGYRHVDTAQMYDNEEPVGEGIARADVSREDVFLATKVLPDNLAHDDVLETTDESLDRLGTEYVDLLYVHWPMKAYDAEDTLPAFDKIAESGKARNIAVSNFTPELLDEAREILDNPILANQVEMHPLFQQEELRDYAREHDITLVAYSPIMQGEADDVPELRNIAEKHDATPTQISLAWLKQAENVVPIPKSTGEKHLQQNFSVPDLDAGDVEKIDSIDREERLVDPDGAAWN
ncbi:2,5-diketo-D-gluconate reductase B [Haladaptatus litoreus]|uniref:2,5-diketo-D-gluconate reductase B n=1 Tax=Haladaptatus litoreus TaxID=553468 RepID=A0A1N7BKX3_9EURY|nr:aldo/keto reductase [Haladaptatus litoreus]SIR51824.1 2,5-diketo-D-gluconate reductase B [Haladaptatus litoreus]